MLYLMGQQTRNQPELQKLLKTAQREVQRVTQISKSMLSLHRESRTPVSVPISDLLKGVAALIEETIAKGKRQIRIEPGFEGEIEDIYPQNYARSLPM